MSADVLPPFARSFVMHFGEMGSRWGINRTVGQIYALLFLSERPLNAEDIVATLGFSRSNVSMGLKELDAWRLIRLQHMPGDRREYFSTPDDIWTIVKTLAEERRRREIDPTLTLLRDVLMEEASSPAEQHAHGRMRELHDLLELLTKWSDDMQKMNGDSLVQLLKLGSRVQKLLEFKGKITLLPGGRSQKKS